MVICETDTIEYLGIFFLELIHKMPTMDEGDRTQKGPSNARPP
jgi:hypothetical protein